jgi:Flp pilus assembly protein CpaB
MQLARKFLPGGDRPPALSTRNGSLAVAVGAAALAGVIILVALAHYRHNADSSGAPVSVLVSNNLIAKGSPADVLAGQGAFKGTQVRDSQLKSGAVTDPAQLRGKVAAHDIYPGQQVTASDFTTTQSAFQTRLTGTDRAIAVPLDASHGLIGDVHAGDHVDVLGGFNVQPVNDSRTHPVLKTMMENVLVLDAPDKVGSGLGSGGSAGQRVVLRMTDQQSAQLAFASDNGKVWLLLRPATGSQASPARIVTLETLLFSANPIAVQHQLRQKGH